MPLRVKNNEKASTRKDKNNGKDNKNDNNNGNNGTGYGGKNNTDTKQFRAGRKRALAKEHKEDAATIEYLSRTLEHVVQSKRAFARSEPNTQQLINVLRTTFRNQVPAEWESRCALYEAALALCRAFCSSPQHLQWGLLFGKKNDPESLLSSLNEFSQHADMIAKAEHTMSKHLSGNTPLPNCKPAEELSDRTGTGNSNGNSNSNNGRDIWLSLATQVMKVNRIATQISKQSRNALPSHNTHPPKDEHATNHDDDDDDDDDDWCVLSEQELYQQELGPLRFDMVQTLPYHAFARTTRGSTAIVGAAAAANLDARTIFKELTAYKSALPVEYGGSIFCRAMNERLDLIRALIIGPEGTPYANGCFVFDIQLSSNYPAVPPKVTFLTTGGGRARFNPNLYNCGKVCLSLLGTWTGPGWISGESTLLQVLISIQSLILVPDPYFNEPGYEASRNTPHGAQQNDAYNFNLRQHTQLLCIQEFLQEAVFSSGGGGGGAASPPRYPEFETVIARHFCVKGRMVKNQVTQWANKDPSLHASARTICDLLALLKKKVTQENAAHQAKQGLAKASVSIIDIDATKQQPRMACKVGETIVLDDGDDATEEATSSSKAATAQTSSFLCGEHEVIELNDKDGDDGDDDDDDDDSDNTSRDEDQMSARNKRVKVAPCSNLVDLT